MHLRRLAALLFAGLLLLTPAAALAQDESPRPNPDAPVGDREAPAGRRLDLAAIALDATDVGDGYTLAYESYTSPDGLGGAVTSAEIEATGIRWLYQSQYASTDGSTQLRVYVEEYGSAADARKGFDLFEDESRTVTDPSITTKDEPGLDAGQAPSEVTVATIPSANGGSGGSTVDATFRVDRLLLGVALDSTSKEPPSADELTDYANRLAERAQAVLDGDKLPDIDGALPGRLLDFAGSVNVNEGYVAFTDVFGASAPTEIGATYTSGYNRTIALGDPASGAPLPLVTVAVASFGDEATPLSILSSAVTVTPAYTGIERDEVEPIPGTSAVVGFRFANAFATAADAPQDSVRLYVLIGTDLLIVEVQGAADADAARGAALAFAGQEVACFNAVDPCGTAQLPAGLGAPKG